MKLTPEEIKERLRAGGNPSIFEEQVLNYIEQLETRIKRQEESVHYYLQVLDSRATSK